MAGRTAAEKPWGATVNADAPLLHIAARLIRELFRPPYLYMVVYLIAYLCGFLFIEHLPHDSYHLVHSPLDDLIPFCEVFAIPYLLWFLYWMGALVFFMGHRMLWGDRGDFALLSWTLAIAMTSFIIVSIVFPNEISLRPAELPRENAFTWMCTMIWARDTPTNVLPSIHVFNSLATHVAICRCQAIKRVRAVRISSGVLCALIIVGTLFIKQHSVVDIATAAVFYAVVYVVVYRSPLTARIVGRPAAK